MPLIDQIREALEHNLYPLFVAEGDSTSKLERIRHSDFLSKAHRSFLNIGGALFVYGLSFASNDAHIFRLIWKSKLRQLFVGIYGDIDTPRNQEIVERAEWLATSRPAAKPLAIHLYDASSAQVWG